MIADGLVFARGGRRLLDGIDIAIEGDGLTVVLGANGAGKTLLLRLLAGLTQADSGDITWAGRPPDRRRAPGLGLVFQKPVLLRRSAYANVRYALDARFGTRAARRKRAVEALARAGLDHLAGTPARVLSGGEQQRLALARAMVVDPEALFLDEPTASLDPGATAAIENMAHDARGRGAKVLWITHDLAQARRLADDIVFLHQGRITERTSAETFFARPESPEARAFIAGYIEPESAA